MIIALSILFVATVLVISVIVHRTRIITIYYVNTGAIKHRVQKPSACHKSIIKSLHTTSYTA